MKKYLLTVLKFAIPVVIIVYLIVNVHRENPKTFWNLAARQKDWSRLTIGFSLAMTAVCITFVRWYLLVRALELSFRLRDAFRLGFLGYLLNFVSAGSVGGDLFKAIFIARQQPKRRPEAVATVVVDRMIGLYALLIVTTLAILSVNMPNPRPDVRVICQITYLCTGVGGIVILTMLVPGFTSGSISEFLSGLPKIGPALERLIAGVRMYRRKPGVLAVIGTMSLGVHCLNAVALYLIASALYTTYPRLVEHLVIVPLGMVASALPLTPAGLGVLEYALGYLYQSVPAEPVDAEQGLVVALTYRIITIVIAMIGVGYYWTSRREVSDLLHEAERDRRGKREMTNE